MIPFYEYHKDLISGYTTHKLNFPLHMHGGPELVRVRSGLLKVQFHSQEYEMSAGQLAVIFPNVIHAFQTFSAEEDTVIDLIVCGQDFKNGFPNKLFGFNISNPILELSALHRDVDYLYSSLHTELEIVRTAEAQKNAVSRAEIQQDAAALKAAGSSQSDSSAVFSAILQLFWLRLLPSLQVCAPKHHSPTDLPTAVISYVSEHFCEPLTLEQLSRELGVCRYYLSRIFTQVLHTGFHEYVNTLRIDYAKKVLLNTQDTILDVAIQCGFQNQQTFNRVFKEFCGVTPSAYRKNT